MSKYIVSIPIAGTITFNVEAENEEDAIEKAWDESIDDGELEYELYEHLTEGNVRHFWNNDIEVEEE